jgi:peptide/nickel transport system permease protein
MKAEKSGKPAEDEASGSKPVRDSLLDSNADADKKLKARIKKSRLWLALMPRLKELKFDAYLMSKSATSIAGIVLLIILVIIAAFPSFFAAPADPSHPEMMPWNPLLWEPRSPGVDGFILGSGLAGADIYYGVIWGARISMAFAIEVVGLSVIIGTLLGLLAGYKGGVLDEIVMRVTDVFLSIPSLVLIMAIAAVLGRNLESTKFALIMVWWSGYTRIIRGQVLSIRENTYIVAAKASGSSESSIMMRHILPNSWAPVVVQATMDMGTVVLVMAGLSYLGLGAEPGTAEWGQMIYAGQDRFITGSWWMVFFPGMAILVFVLAFNLIGDGLRDVLDPKMRR